MKKIIPFLALLVFTTYACSDDDDNATQPCTNEVVPAIKVLITNARTSASLGDGLTVTAVDGSYIDELDYASAEGYFFGANERVGTYIVTVTGEGYEPYASAPVTVTEDECHVITQIVNVALQPAE